MLSHSTIRVFAPAKLNLFLEVLRKRADGFHDIQTLISAIDIYDILDLRSEESGILKLACQWSPGFQARNSRGVAAPQIGTRIWSSLPEPEDNLVYRVLARLRDAAGVRLGATIRLRKRIPAEAGLGGASSDAAAALIAANAAWGLEWSPHELARLGAELGSDIPFFFSSGAAVCEGRGERVESIDSAPLHCVVVKPPVGLSTAHVYRDCRPGMPVRSCEAIVDACRRGVASDVAKTVFNRLEAPADTLAPVVVQVREQLKQTGCLAAQMTGSGTCCFGVYRTARQARVAAARLRQRNIGWVSAASTVGGFANQHEGIARWKSLRFASN